MDRYSEITNETCAKVNREIVLLKGFPCVWGKCTFCDYIEDNSELENEMNKLNFEILDKVTGKYGVLEVINSGSCFELPKLTLEKIKEVIKEKNIDKIFLESHWSYKKRIKSMRDYIGIPVIFKIGVESFDYNFRNNVLNKNAKFQSIEELQEYFDSPCIMVGIKGQTKEMINNDIEILLKNFEHATVNVFIDNSTDIKRDDEIVKWFIKKYKFLNDNPNIEVLHNNTDFGVGD